MSYITKEEFKNDIEYNNILLKPTKYFGYYAGSDGEIYCLLEMHPKRRNSENPLNINKIRKIKGTKTTKCNYKCYKIRYNGKYIWTLGHRLVTMAFIPTENMENLVVNHKDFDRWNNRPENLEWVTVEENVLYSLYANHNKKAKIVKIFNVETQEELEFPSINQSLKYFGKVCNRTLVKCFKENKLYQNKYKITIL